MDTVQWPLRRLGLKVLDIEKSIEYYTRLGLVVVRDERANGQVGMGVGTKELLSLRSLSGGRPRPRHTAGLYHFAILLPDEDELGSFLQHCIDVRIPVAGASDHLVSQALYLSDPEGNGIEVYADRPRANWQWNNSEVAMATNPLDIPALLKRARPFTSFSEQTLLGHMHLNVGDLQRSQDFYATLGMELTAGWAGQASFLSWDGYHHHLGMNLWAGRNVARVEPGVAGLDFYEIARPGLPVGTLQDPDGVNIVSLPVTIWKASVFQAVDE